VFLCDVTWYGPGNLGTCFRAANDGYNQLTYGFETDAGALGLLGKPGFQYGISLRAGTISGQIAIGGRDSSSTGISLATFDASGGLPEDMKKIEWSSGGAIYSRSSGSGQPGLVIAATDDGNDPHIRFVPSSEAGGNQGTGDIRVYSTMDLFEIGAPADTPPSGYLKLWAKNDGSAYVRNSAGKDVSFAAAETTVSAIPACSSTFAGSTRAVSDSTTNTWGVTAAGGGSNHVAVYCDGTNWTVYAK